MDSVSWASFPGEHLDESVTLDIDNPLLAREPAQRVVHQPQQVAMTGEPVGALNVAREPGQATRARLAKHDSRLRRVRLRRIGQFRRIVYESRHDREQGIGDGVKRNAVLRSGN